MSTALAIETSGLGKRFGSTWALQDCTLAVPPGHVTALVGANGAGKTTLLRLLVGLATPTAGSARVRRIPRSVPACGSVRHIVLVHSPVTSFCRKRALSSSLPWRVRASTAPSERPLAMRHAIAALQSISPTAMCAIAGRFWPPKSGAADMPAQPLRQNC